MLSILLVRHQMFNMLCQSLRQRNIILERERIANLQPSNGLSLLRLLQELENGLQLLLIHVLDRKGQPIGQFCCLRVQA